MSLGRIVGIARQIALVGALCALAPVAFAFSTPARTGWVTDEAGILDAETASAIASRLEQLQRKTGDEVVVVTLASLQGAAIETWGNVLGESWGIGRGSGQDTGALLIVAPNERQVRIAIGYGLGNRISDDIAAMIVDDHILPYFRQGDFPRGVRAGVDSIILQLAPQGTAVTQAGDVERAGPVVAYQRPSFWEWLKYKLTPSRQTKVIMIWIGVIIVVLLVMTFAGAGWGRSRRYDDDHFSSSSDDDDGWFSGGGGSSNSGSSGGSFGRGATGSW